MADLVLVELKQTCQMAPSQWEGRTSDDRPAYIRYRHGYLSVHIGPVGGDLNGALDADEWYGEQLNGDNDSGIELADVCRAAGIVVSLK
jgi:hypothetical protein